MSVERRRRIGIRASTPSRGNGHGQPLINKKKQRSRGPTKHRFAYICQYVHVLSGVGVGFRSGGVVAPPATEPSVC